MDEDEAISNEEVYEDYKEFKNLILQTSKIVSEQQAKMDHLLQQLSKIPGIKGQDDGRWKVVNTINIIRFCRQD